LLTRSIPGSLPSIRTPTHLPSIRADIFNTTLRVAIIRGPRCKPERTLAFQNAVAAEWTTELSGQLDAVLVFGGDGTVHRHLEALRDANAPVLVVPIGSGNDFASSLGIHNPRQALKLWKQFIATGSNVLTSDLGCVTSRQPLATSHLFCNVANFGLDSDINRRANQLPPFLRANGGYVLSLFPALLSYRAPKVKLVADGVDIEEELLLAVAANGIRYGRGLKIAPNADLSDGMLDLCLVRNTSKLRVSALFPLVYFGKHLALREVQYFRFRTLTVETAEPLDIYADGEYLCRTRAMISVLPAALRVIAPRS
jgi:diacylglycerol kinase (ATP)